ncbi:MAG: serine/threonine protein kinase [Thainema sp.]
MNNLLNFSKYGYHIEKELGANRAGGRVTYLATDISTNQKVVIKQFQFAQFGSDWSDYDAHKREVEVLHNLNHPGIPRYLNSFQTADGFCIVQEYKAAESLVASRSFHPEELKTIAIKILEILAYLQNRIPPIVHRDLKPDNVLVDENLNVFLVDFGFARIGDGEVGVSSVVKGTLGFMPPEQLFNRQLTEASDLYGLGMTLICLLTHTKTDDIGTLVDISYRVKFKHLVPKLSFPWVKWLEKMVEPRVADRFLNAREALKALPNSPLHPPEVRLSHSELHLHATRINQILTHSIEIRNFVPEVILTGAWKVQKHPNDPLNTDGSHVWIHIDPQKFEENRAQCCIEVDTSKLMAGEIYSRTLILDTNAFPQTYSVRLQVHTARIPIRSMQNFLLPLCKLFVSVLVGGHLLLWIALSETLTYSQLGVINAGLSLGAIVGLQGAAWTLKSAGAINGSNLTTVTTACLGFSSLIGIWLFMDKLFGSWDIIFYGLTVGIFGGWLLGLVTGLTVERLLKEQILKTTAIALVLLTSFLSISLAIGLVTGFSHPLVLLTTAILLIALGSLLVNASLDHTKRIAYYRRLERNRIRP